jgi:hypothetical protein
VVPPRPNSQQSLATVFRQSYNSCCRWRAKLLLYVSCVTSGMPVPTAIRLAGNYWSRVVAAIAECRRSEKKRVFCTVVRGWGSGGTFFLTTRLYKHQKHLSLSSWFLGFQYRKPRRLVKEWHEFFAVNSVVLDQVWSAQNFVLRRNDHINTGTHAAADSQPWGQGLKIVKPWCIFDLSPWNTDMTRYENVTRQYRFFSNSSVVRPASFSF